jgi:hypothetical protein
MREPIIIGDGIELCNICNEYHGIRYICSRR